MPACPCPDPSFSMRCLSPSHACPPPLALLALSSLAYNEMSIACTECMVEPALMWVTPVGASAPACEQGMAAVVGRVVWFDDPVHDVRSHSALTCTQTLHLLLLCEQLPPALPPLSLPMPPKPNPSRAHHAQPSMSTAFRCAAPPDTAATCGCLPPRMRSACWRRCRRRAAQCGS